MIGENAFRYAPVKDWENNLLRYNVSAVPGICISKQDRIIILSRSNPPIIEMDTQGNIIQTWGNNIFERAHGVFLSNEGELLCTDDAGHTAYQFKHEHFPQITMGIRNTPSDTGCINKRWQTIQRSAGPFNYPTNITLSRSGDIYVSDGYGNACVHVFNPLGILKFSWGNPGAAPGNFNLPHSLRFDAEERLYVCDRANNRIQLFDKHGNYLEQWTNFERPADLYIDDDNFIIYVAECKRNSHFNGLPSRISVVDFSGNILARISGDDFYDESIGHHTAHGIAVDSKGDIYVAEVGKKFPSGYIGLKKYRRI